MPAETKLTLMTVHAHPDDEAIGTGGILAKYAAEGIRTVLVTCTRGEMGEVQDPTYTPPEPGMTITQIRELEMAQALEILRVGAYHNLGYRDSGMAGTEGNEDPRAFCRTDKQEAVRKLVRLMRKERPQVVVTYDENGLYGHPDHIMANQITQSAFSAAGDATFEPDSPEPPWQPAKLYYLAIPMRRLKKFRDENKKKDPEDDPPSSIVTTPEELITTQIDVTGVLEEKFKAIFSHRSQIAAGHFFRQLPSEKRAGIFGTEHFVCVEGFNGSDSEKENDFFSGLRS